MSHADAEELTSSDRKLVVIGMTVICRCRRHAACSLKQRNCSENSGVVADFRRAHFDLAPGRPGMFFDICLDVRENHVGALHHAAAENDDFWVVGVDQADGRRCPDLQTSITKGERDWVVLGREAKQFLKLIAFS